MLVTVLFVFLVLVSFLVCVSLVCRKRVVYCRSKACLVGKTALVTGGASGEKINWEISIIRTFANWKKNLLLHYAFGLKNIVGLKVRYTNLPEWTRNVEKIVVNLWPIFKHRIIFIRIIDQLNYVELEWIYTS